MVFSSFVFLLAFLPIVLLLYYLCPARLRNLVLLVLSLVFYAWGEPVYVLIMLFSIVFDYANGRLIEHFKNKNCPGKAKAALIVDLCGNLAILGFFKYTDFVIGSINSITGAGLSLLHIALPIGISFYTFQTMSYTIDVYRGLVKAQRNLISFGMYVCMFPQLIAGPIVRYQTIADQIDERKENNAVWVVGMQRFILGLAKKLDEDITKLLDTNDNLSVTKAAVFCAMDYLDEYRKSTGSAENMRSQIQDYIADAARAKLAEDKALAENAVLRREAAALREQLAKERQRETRREERAARAAAETAQEQPAPEAPAADSAQTDETN